MSKIKVGDRVKVISQTKTERAHGLSDKMYQVGAVFVVKRVFNTHVEDDRSYSYSVEDLALVSDKKEKRKLTRKDLEEIASRAYLRGLENNIGEVHSMAIAKEVVEKYLSK